MKITVLTIVPEVFCWLNEHALVQRAVKRGLLEVDIIDIKDYAGGSFRHIDDSVYGPGAGMVIKYPAALAALEKAGKGRRILLSASGAPYTQKTVHRYAGYDHLILLCGHYEGFDARIEADVDEETSVGDYILSGGEPAAYTIIDSVVRLLGTIREESTEEESFENGLLEYPQYTSPRSFNGRDVPEVLLSGNHEAIRRWRTEESLKRTAERRPDLLKDYEPSEEEKEILAGLRIKDESSILNKENGGES